MKRLLVCLLLCVGVVGCGESEQDRAITALEKYGPAIKKDKHGNAIDLYDRTNGIGDADLKYLEGLPKIEGLVIGNQVTDAGLEHLKGLTQLKSLNLGSGQFTDAGLEHLRGLVKLESLVLNKEITDAGLEHLKGLTNLSFLNLAGTQVTDAGVAELQKALPDCEITH